MKSTCQLLRLYHAVRQPCLYLTLVQFPVETAWSPRLSALLQRQLYFGIHSYYHPMI